MKIGILKDSIIGEKRVALTPANIRKLAKKKLEFLVQSGAGLAANFQDEDYIAAGARITDNRINLCQQADILVVVNGKGAQFDELLPLLSPKQLLIGMMDPLTNTDKLQPLAATGVTAIALELIPRITRAQSMDVLSSMATVAGYKAVLLAAHHAPRLFPMMMTAAGTLRPCKAFIMGVGVAGLQACATAKRLGAVVEAYDIRPAAQEQILSVGAKPVQLDIDTQDTETKGGYAAEQSDDFIKKQQQAMARVLAQQDIVVTTAAIPGRPAPKLITAAMVDNMKPGTVIVDLAAESGGNCELTRVNEVVWHQGVMILGPGNIAASAATHASQMFGTNVENLLNLLIDKDGQLQLDFDDEIVRETVITHNQAIPHTRLRDMLQLPSLNTDDTLSEA